MRPERSAASFQTKILTQGVDWEGFSEKIGLDSLCPINFCRIIFMKYLKRIETRFRKTETLIARFGTARLVRTDQGRYELRGGTKEERLCAIEWVSMFLHEVTFKMTD